MGRGRSAIVRGHILDINQANTILVTCGPGLADFLQREIEALGFAVESVHRGGVEIKASFVDAMKLNLHLRTAYNVLYLLRQFPCDGPDELYEEVGAVAWEEIIPPNEYISIVGRIDTASIDNSMFASLKVKDAIADRMVEKTGARPDSGKEKRAIVINLYWRDDRAWLYLNTSGLKLTDRGYRRIPFKAPMRESLAAGLVMATGYDGAAPLVNPMCGSGTLAIEAALIAARRAPGLLRTNFGFTHLNCFDEDLWRTIRNDATKEGRKLAKKNRPARIIATDISPDAIVAARKNAMTAGVEHLIDFSVCDFADTTVPDEKGIVVVNPEYGVRLGEMGRLGGMYKRLGDFFKQKCPGWTCYIFTGNLPLAKKVGLRTSRRTAFFNADIECRLLKYDMYQGRGQEF